MRDTVAPRKTGRWRWAAVPLLLLTAVIAGSGLTAPICYWQGRGLSRNLNWMPLAYAPKSAPFYWAMLGAALLWMVLWWCYARADRHSGRGWRLAAVILAVFVAAAWQGATTSYACFPY